MAWFLSPSNSITVSSVLDGECVRVFFLAVNFTIIVDNMCVLKKTKFRECFRTDGFIGTNETGMNVQLLSFERYLHVSRQSKIAFLWCECLWFGVTLNSSNRHLKLLYAHLLRHLIRFYNWVWQTLISYSISNHWNQSISRIQWHLTLQSNQTVKKLLIFQFITWLYQHFKLKSSEIGVFIRTFSPLCIVALKQIYLTWSWNIICIEKWRK